MRVLSLFSFYGRASRSTWWLTHLLSVAVMFVVLLLISIAFSGKLPSDGRLATSDEIGNGGVIAFVVAGFFYVWANLCVNAKRWHDRDKSGWWQLISLIPLIGIWALIENGFLRDTAGSNRFGPNPLAKG